MKPLYSVILPLSLGAGQESISDCFHKEMINADRVEIAVGYVSRASIGELDRLTDEYGTTNICLVIGM